MFFMYGCSNKNRKTESLSFRKFSDLYPLKFVLARQEESPIRKIEIPCNVHAEWQFIYFEQELSD